MSFNPNELHLEALTVDEAKATALGMLKATKMKASKLSHLIRDVQKAPTSREVQRIMWNTMLSGTGFGITDSSWQKLHKTI